MKYILGTVIAILCSFTCTDTLYGKSPATDVDDILIINTYTEANHLTYRHSITTTCAKTNCLIPSPCLTIIH